MSGLLGKSNLGGGGTGKAFAAISVTYPAGSICTATNGNKTLKAKDTSGTWLCLVREGGSWTFECHSDNGKNANKIVNVTEHKTYALVLEYETILFPGTTLGNWSQKAWARNPGAAGSSAQLTTSSTSINVKYTPGGGQWNTTFISPANKINCTGKVTLRLKVQIVSWTESGISLAVVRSTSESYFDNAVTLETETRGFDNPGEYTTVAMDISNLDGEQIIGILAGCRGGKSMEFKVLQLDII